MDEGNEHCLYKKTMTEYAWFLPSVVFERFWMIVNDCGSLGCKRFIEKIYKTGTNQVVFKLFNRAEHAILFLVRSRV